jgi:hypothetical protein
MATLICFSILILNTTPAPASCHQTDTIARGCKGDLAVGAGTLGGDVPLVQAACDTGGNHGETEDEDVR